MVASTTPVKVAVVGVGYMGKKHAEKYKDLAGAELVAVVDTDHERAHEVARDCGCPPYKSLDRMLEHHSDLQAASIAVPTIHHAQVARTLIERGVACLIEKPLAPSTREARWLAELAERRGVPLQVGHVERFNPAVRAVQRLGPEPLMIRSDRVGHMSFRSLDVDVVLDVMIHDLDLALLFTGSGLEGTDIEARGIALDGQPEHIANARILFPGGCLADLTASRIALTTKREVRLFTCDSYISIDCRRKRAVLVREKDYVEGLRVARQLAERGQEIGEQRFRELIRAQDLVGDNEAQQDPLTTELEEFLTAVGTGRLPEVDAGVGFRALALAERVTEQMRMTAPVRSWQR